MPVANDLHLGTQAFELGDAGDRVTAVAADVEELEIGERSQSQ
jgi:hypothetical protein